MGFTGGEMLFLAGKVENDSAASQGQRNFSEELELEKLHRVEMRAPEIRKVFPVLLAGGRNVSVAGLNEFFGRIEV
jgi:hypothetical protein